MNSKIKRNKGQTYFQTNIHGIKDMQSKQAKWKQ